MQEIKLLKPAREGGDPQPGISPWLLYLYSTPLMLKWSSGFE